MEQSMSEDLLRDLADPSCLDCDGTGNFYQMDLACSCTGQRIVKPSKSEQRKAQRKARKAAQRKAERAMRLSNKAKVSHSIPKVITYDDLDGDQLIAAEGLKDWWRILSEKDVWVMPKPLSIGGYAGTGKSTLLGVMLPLLRQEDGASIRTKYCAYTGKAADVLMKKGLPASTIHALIYNAVPHGDEVMFILKNAEDVKAELIVVDEASMVPEDMRADLESLGIPILYTGDHGQLPPVKGQGNVMQNPNFKLEQIHRQAEDSGIITVATAVRQGSPLEKGVYGIRGDAEIIGSAAIEDTVLLASADMVICYTNKTRAALNGRLREYKGYKGIMPNIGEKLICVRNNKDMQMFNGLILYVKEIKEEAGIYVMDLVDELGKEFLGIKAFNNYFEGHEHPKIYGKTTLNTFEFAYAITGHKSQGSQWDHVVMVEEKMARQKVDIKRRWKYTVCTRAAKRLTWISRFR